MLSNDDDRGIERVTIAEVRRGHSKVASNWQEVTRGFCRDAIPDSGEILFSDFLRRTEIMSAREPECGVKSGRASRESCPPGPVKDDQAIALRSMGRP
jgi:hypothetical protein